MPVQAGYDRWAEVYDHDANPLQAMEEPIVVEAIGSVNGLRVLDLGCGTGRHALRMAAAGAVVTAIDFSEEMLTLAQCKPNSERVRFLTHDLLRPLPFADEFDLVVCGLVLEHIDDLTAFYQEMARVLKDPGRVVVSFMHPMMFARGAQARFTDPDSDEVIEVESRMHTVSEAVMAALKAGFPIGNFSEHSPDLHVAERSPRAAKYVGWPMLVVQALTEP